MQIGLVYPQTEFGSDPAAIRDYAQSAEALGYSHILVYDHVLGANPDRPDKLKGPYTNEHPFQEPLVLLGFIAAATRSIGLMTGVLILPQRQTVLVAKQAATVDVLSAGRLRLGVGLGWNHVEYISLGVPMEQRGRRIEEQVDVMRRLWREPLVTYSGQWHRIPDAGLVPMPCQRPIPVWFGGHSEAMLRRAARIGDGWIPNYRTAQDAQPSLEAIERYLGEAGRTRAEFGIEARLTYGDGNPDVARQRVAQWRAAGATHASMNTMQSGLAGAREHLQAIRKYAGAVGLGKP